jgi:hypothetical protein
MVIVTPPHFLIPVRIVLNLGKLIDVKTYDLLRVTFLESKREVEVFF